MDEETMAVEAAFDGGNHAAKAVQSYIDKLKAEIALLKDAIRRLAEQDATLSVCDGAVTVTMDGTLTDAEREAMEIVVQILEAEEVPKILRPHLLATLRALLERQK